MRGPQDFIQDVFLDSDTDMMVLSFVPSRRDSEPLTIEEADGVRQIIANMEGTERLLLHGRVSPNQPGDLEGMDELAERWGVVAWKTYTQWGPDGIGFFLSDENTGIPFIEKARALGVKVICVHKGLPFEDLLYEYSLCDDIGVVAKRYPDMTFIVYHSGWIRGQAELAYAPEAGRDGVDSLVRSLIKNEVPPNSNVYAELGSTWRGWIQDPDSAAHGLGKLFTYVGEDNVLWGTDSIWYGSPQDQIQAFRTFQISEALREQYGYPEITPELRAKVFGLNATRPYQISAAEVLKRASVDPIGRQRPVYREDPDPHFLTFGPKTRRAFKRLLRLQGGYRG
jgi:predicted TIM-barrel fold metal-dependent hydrolase